MILDPRFNGPPGSANGGYACGVFSRLVDGCAEVTLRLPPPLGVELRTGDGRVYDGDALVAEVRPAERPAPELPPHVPLEAAAATRYAGLDRHPFPTCFACGPARNDGLALRPGPVAPGIVATPWIPESAEPEITWAALDCPSGWATEIGEGREAVLGRMTADLPRPVTPGTAYVVTGWSIGAEGRKHRAGSVVRDESGEVYAVALATWIYLAR